MKLLNKKSLCIPKSISGLAKTVVLSSLFIAGLQTSVNAQKDSIAPPKWWVGIAGGVNINFYNGSTQKLNNDLTSPTPFHSGKGFGLFLGPLVEYHQLGKRWGFMLQAGYDSRKGKFNEIKTPCNCPTDLSTKLSYVTVEPSLRIAPFKGNFYMYVGPRFAYNLDKSFIFHQKVNPEYPDQIANPAISGDLSDVKPVLVSAQVGIGYDINLSAKTNQTQYVLSPFVSFQPYFGQEPRTIESWNVTTVRAGAAFKFGRGRKVSHDAEKADAIAVVPVKTVIPEPAAVAGEDANVAFTINSPNNIPVERRVRETFPIRNYVFFDEGSTHIPTRYVLLEKSQVKEFKEEQLEVFAPKNLTGRSKRQMVAYYNILNILGDRMNKKPTTTIILAGSSEQGIADGQQMAESVKKYLVTTFGIAPGRITTLGLDKPRIPSGVEGGTTDLSLLAQGNRRVTIETTSPTLLMEFQSGQDAPLKPVELVGVQEAPIDSYVTFNVSDEKDAIKTWSLQVTDEKGVTQNFGPYEEGTLSLPGKTILGTRPEGDYTVKMTGKTKSGKTVTKEAKMHMVLWTPPKDEEGVRYSVIFDYNEAKATTVYEKYLTDIVVPKIPVGGKVIIHGYTDIIGNADYNKKLSVKRANDVKAIMESALAKAGRTDVTFELFGFGEDEGLAPFENKFPEERFYNRSVIIDIIPKK
ncbi:MAG: outer membrane beta-barrel protein [Bacteroidetes bacterium]|nr:outer membrane beta-barrel protein [Bacteroidota bacterium]